MCLHPDVIDALAAAGATVTMIAAAYRAAWAAENGTARKGLTIPDVAAQAAGPDQIVDVNEKVAPLRLVTPHELTREDFVSVYVIGKIEDGNAVAPCKIGVASNPRSRLSTFQTATPFKIGVVAEITLPTRAIALDLESGFHAIMQPFRSHGEWFDMHPVRATGILATLADAKLRLTLQGDDENYRNARKVFGIEAALVAFRKACPP